MPSVRAMETLVPAARSTVYEAKSAEEEPEISLRCIAVE